MSRHIRYRATLSGPAHGPTDFAQLHVRDPEVMTYLVNDRPPDLLDET
ncbi:MAG: hypothetical protein ABIZ07_12655 [Dermatophilaceae bacterium]